MPLTADDVGKRMVDGVATTIPLAERQAIAAEWNANETTAATRRAAEATKESRLTALRALVASDTATPSNMNEFISLLGL